MKYHLTSLCLNVRQFNSYYLSVFVNILCNGLIFVPKCVLLMCVSFKQRYICYCVLTDNFYLYFPRHSYQFTDFIIYPALRFFFFFYFDFFYSIQNRQNYSMHENAYTYIYVIFIIQVFALLSESVALYYLNIV